MTNKLAAVTAYSVSWGLKVWGLKVDGGSMVDSEESLMCGACSITTEQWVIETPMGPIFQVADLMTYLNIFVSVVN